MIVIFTIKRWMKDKEGFNLRKALCAWNGMLCVFSIVGSYYLVPEMYEMLLSPRGSLYRSVCISTTSTSAQYWLWLFILSKVVELGDTMFIVLRKQQLIFLHWFHHVVTLIFCWYSTAQNISLGPWFAVMNYLVHSLMYGYYAARAIRFRVPRPFAMMITCLQIMQMAIGLGVCTYALWSRLTGTYCEIPTRTAAFGFSMYVAFFILFVHFFQGAYVSSSKRPPSSGVAVSGAAGKPSAVQERAQEKLNDGYVNHRYHGDDGSLLQKRKLASKSGNAVVNGDGDALSVFNSKNGISKHVEESANHKGGEDVKSNRKATLRNNNVNNNFIAKFD